MFGKSKGEFMVTGSRNLCLYPNVYLMDQFTTQIRHFRPISVDRTEVTIYCIAPKGESTEARANRSASTRTSSTPAGMATPDDLEDSVPANTFRARRAVERHEPGRRALVSGPDDVATVAWHGRRPLGRDQDRGRRAVPGSARLLARRHERAPSKSRKSRRPPPGPAEECDRHDHRQHTSPPGEADHPEPIEQFLYREARYLDDREFEKWLECYPADFVYWMPSWDDDDRLVEDPQPEISLIYYPNRGRLGRPRLPDPYRSFQSATSIPDPRTSYNISNVEVIERRGSVVDLRFNWFTLYFRYNTVDPYFGMSFHDRLLRVPLIRAERSPGERLHPPCCRHLSL